MHRVTTHCLLIALILGMLAAPVQSKDYSSGDIVVVVVESELTDAADKAVGSVCPGELLEIKEVGEEKLRLTDGGYLLRNQVMPTTREAINRLTTQIKADSKDSRLYSGRGAVWVGLREWDRAFLDFDEAIRLGPNADTYCNRGMAWLTKGDHPKALIDFDEAIRIAPMHSRSYRSRGFLWECQGEWDKSIADYSEAIRIGPVSATLYASRANIWNHQREYLKAIGDYDEALRLNPDCVKYLAWRGSLLSHVNQHDRAIVDLNKAIRLYPQRGNPREIQLSPIYMFRSGAWSAHGDFDKAMTDLDEMDRIEPQGPRIHHLRGNIFKDMGEYQKAISEYSKEILADPKDANAYYARGMIYLHLGKKESLDDFERVLEFAIRESATALSSASYGYLSAKLSGDEKRAASFLQFLTRTDSEYWPAPFTKLLQGEVDETAFLDLARKKNQSGNSHEGEAHCLLGLKCLADGHPADAVTHFQWMKVNCPKGSQAYSMSVNQLKRLASTAP